MINDYQDFRRQLQAQREGRGNQQDIEILDDDDIVDAEPVAESTLGGLGQPLERPKRESLADALERRQVARDAATAAEEAARALIGQPTEHQLGRLAISSLEATTEVPSAFDPRDVLEMLQNPKRMRQAIIISEILNRPVQRWR